MDSFWKWLKKANARAVFFCLLAATVGMTGWWVWKLVTPVRAPALVAGAGQSHSNPPLGVLDFLESQKSAASNRPTSLFAFPEPPPPPPKPDNEVRPPKPTPKPDAEKPPPQPPPPPAKEVIELTYQGMMQRDDGTFVALIRDSKTGNSAFYPIGTNIFSLKLQTVEAGSLSVDQSDGSVTTLKRGLPVSFSEGRRHGQ